MSTVIFSGDFHYCLYFNFITDDFGYNAAQSTCRTSYKYVLHFIDIVFNVERSREFIREGADIFSEITVNIPQLVLGDIFEVNTVSGKVKVRVPPGTQPGSLVKLKGKGAVKLGGNGHGDHYVRVNLDVPKHPSEQEKRLYEELKNLSSKKKGWF